MIMSNIIYTTLLTTNSQLCRFFLSGMPTKDLAPFSYISPQKPPFQRWTMNSLSNSCQQTGKKSENGKKGPTHEPRYCASAKSCVIIAVQPFYRCRQNARKNITVAVSVRVSVMVRVSLIWFVSTNSFGASSVAICWCCVCKILVAFAQRCVYNKCVAYYTRLCI